MSHNELSNKILKDALVMRHELQADEDAVFTRLAKFPNALLAVLELHKPFQFIDGCAFYYCEECQLEHANDGDVSSQYPCDTIKAIEEKIK
jgi:hypothetical protein